MLKVLALVALFLPALLPLQGSSTGVFFLVALWYIGTFLLISLAILEQKHVKKLK